MARILIIDDDPSMCGFIERMARQMGHESEQAPSLQEGLEKVSAGAYDLVLLDVCLPDGSGLDVLSRIRESGSLPEVIIMTGSGDPDGAELAIRSGAWSYVAKPFSAGAMRLPMERALQYHSEKTARRGDMTWSRAVKALRSGGIVGGSRRMLACLDQLAQAASCDANVLITGETGTGKELFARAIHNNSARSEKPFVVVDCATLPETLAESMLLGHARGAFTGADRTQEGMIRQAHGGTLLLDEVGELPLTVQKAFLRVLQERRYRPLGAREEITSDFRLVAATHRDLQAMVQEERFRQDLFFRLCSLTIGLPPLRERREDLRDLASFHLSRLCQKSGRGMKGFSPPFLDALESYPWPGNVRELIGCLESALAAAGDEPTLFPDHLPIHIRIHLARASVAPPTPDPPPVQELPAVSHAAMPTLCAFRESATQTAENNYLQALMAQPGISIAEACRAAGLSRPRLYALLKKHGIVRTP